MTTLAVQDFYNIALNKRRRYMIQLKDAWTNREEVESGIPTPDYSHIIDAKQISKPKWIEFSKIDMGDMEGNDARLDGIDPATVQELEQSFAKGIRRNEEIAAVKFRGDEFDKPYILIYGYHRTYAQLNLGVKGFAFNVIDASETQIEDIQSFENEPKPPKRNNKEADIVQIKAKQLKKGTIANNEDAIFANLKKTYPTRALASIQRIAAKLHEEMGTPVKYSYYTAAKIKIWRADNCSEWFEIEGKLDDNLDEYGFTTKIGGLYRTVHRALQNYADTGKVSYVNCFADTVTKGSTLEQQRKSILNEYITLMKNHAKVYGKSVMFLRLNGLFPQAYGVDDWKGFIKYDQKEIKKLIESN